MLARTNVGRSDQLPILDVVVAGGSLAGLSAAVVLHRLGHNVEVYERVEDTDRAHQGAGIVLRLHTNEFFKRFGLPPIEAISVACPGRQYLNKKGQVMRTENYPQRMTSWSVLYRCLMDAFPQERLHAGIAVEGVGAKGDSKVVVRLDGGAEVDADMVIGADGARSKLREQLFPGVQRQYAGYVAWRGVVSERDLSPALAALFVERFTFYHGPATQILAYLIPGRDGSNGRGQRDLNWVWYWNYKEGPELDDVLLDSHGRRHEYSVPQGSVRRAVWDRQRRIAKEHLATPFAELVCMTKDPFMQVITDLGVPRMTAGRIALVGEAAFIPRPHTAASADMAFSHALSFADLLAGGARPRDVPKVLLAWEQDEILYGGYLQELGQSLGDRSQFGDPNKMFDPTGGVVHMAP